MPIQNGSSKSTVSLDCVVSTILPPFHKNTAENGQPRRQVTDKGIPEESMALRPKGAKYEP
jgi:hypothetical protein